MNPDVLQVLEELGSEASLGRERPVEEYLDAMDAVIYADLFDSAAAFDGVLRFAGRAIDAEELEEVLGELVAAGVLSGQDEAFCLAGNERCLRDFEDAKRRAERLCGRAVRVARWLQYLPFLRGLSVSGSCAAGQADQEADVDLLLFVERRRMATTFLLCGGLSRLLGRALFCPNFYLADDALELDRRTLFVARELFQTRPLAGIAESLAAENAWARELLPNATVEPMEATSSRGGLWIQAILERMLLGKLGDRLEAWAGGFVERRLATHYREHYGTVPDTVLKKWRARAELRFHGAEKMINFMHRYKERRQQVLAILESVQWPGPDSL